MKVYYNEIDPYCCQWLQNLMDAGHIPKGVIDDRDIRDIAPKELREFDQCHFFAGLGGWAYALHLAGADELVCWTGSCPCQPFSAAGKRKGANDERDLWPAFNRLITKCRPNQVFGEQVASAVKDGWLDRICADLETEDYAVGAVIMGAHSVGAPHIRQRLWWVADANPDRQQEQRGSGLLDGERAACGNDADGCGAVRGVGNADGMRLSRQCGRRQGGAAEPGGDCGGLPNAGGQGLPAPEYQEFQGTRRGREGRAAAELRGAQGAWSDYIWIPCADGKARRIESSIEPLADGIPARVGRLRAYGNAIVPEVAAEFISAYLDARL